MAIITAEQRRAAMAPCFAYYSPGVTPNAAKDEEWRKEAGHAYIGTSSTPPPPAIDTFISTARISRQRRAA